jgi:hypothetical protein
MVNPRPRGRNRARTEARPKPQPLHPDHEAAVARLQDAPTKATGCDARVRPHRDGYQVILDQAGGERLISFLDGTDTGR